MVKVDSLVKLHILPRDGASRAERLETWEDVKESISRAPPPPPPAEEDVRLADAAHSVGGFGRLVKNKVKAAVGRGKDREEPKAVLTQPEPFNRSPRSELLSTSSDRTEIEVV
eukprot:EG_transcript_27234